MPTALIAPARAKHRKQPIPRARLDPQGDRVAVGTAIALGKQIEKKDRGENGTKHEKPADNRDTQNGVPHPAFPPAATAYSRFSTSAHASTNARSSSIRSITTSVP